MNRLYITIIFVLFAILGHGQNIRQRVVSAPSPRIRKDLPKIRTKSARMKLQRQDNQHVRQQRNTLSKQDTVYAMQTAKQHGWFLPIGILTKEQTQHRRSSFMFTGKNKRGHWTKIETINAYGGHSKGNFQPYILYNGSVDDSANKEWIKRLRGACIIEMIADPQGNNVIQERVYDEDHNLLYVYSRTPIGVDKNGKNQYIGSYKDMYGLPAEMRKEEGYTYGTLVRITEDEWGNDSIIEYLDGKGANKLNSSKVFRSVYRHDKNGHLLWSGSQNDKEEYVIDSWGNCGYIQAWNEDHTKASLMYTDSKEKPMKMPSEKAQKRCGVIKVLYKYDEYKRMVEESFVNADDNPMTNVYGCHKIEYVFDTRGNVIGVFGYDECGKFSQQDSSGMAVINRVFDDKGKLIGLLFFDKSLKPCNTKGYLSKERREYDAEGNEVLFELYSAETGSEKLFYKRETTPEYIYTLREDGTSSIDSLDSKGRTTFVGFYGADGNYKMIDGRAYEVYTYIEQDKKTWLTQVKYDQNGNKIEDFGVCKVVVLVDSINWTKTNWSYDKNNVLTDVYILRYTPNFKSVIAQNDANKFGIVARCGGNPSGRYFKGNVMYNQKGEKMTHHCGIDEFGEPDYITSSDVTYYYSKSEKLYDVNNNEITDYEAIKDKLPKVMTIEVVDSSAYELGLKDNDVILLYGDYAVDLDTIVSNLTFRQEWTLRSVIDASKEKRMVVFRITDASKNEYGLYEIPGLKGTCSELGFLPHIRYLTDKQLNRIKESVKNEIMKSNPLIAYNDFKKANNEGGSNYVMMSYPEMYRSNRDKPYAKQITDPSIMLGSCIKDRNMKWTKENGDDVKPFEDMLSTRKSTALNYPRQDFFVTKDGISMEHLILDDQIAYVNGVDARISDKDYEKIKQLYNNACDSINVMLRRKNKHKQKLFLGNWKIENNDSTQYQPEAFLSLSKDETCKGRVINYEQIYINESDKAVYKIVRSFRGKWHNSDNWLFIYPEKDSIIINLMNCENEPELKSSFLRNFLLERMAYDENKIGNDFYDVIISKKAFEAKLESGKKIIFTKTKEKFDELTVTKTDAVLEQK